MEILMTIHRQGKPVDVEMYFDSDTLAVPRVAISADGSAMLYPLTAEEQNFALSRAQEQLERKP